MLVVFNLHVRGTGVGHIVAQARYAIHSDRSQSDFGFNLISSLFLVTPDSQLIPNHLCFIFECSH